MKPIQPPNQFKRTISQTHRQLCVQVYPQLSPLRIFLVPSNPPHLPPSQPPRRYPRRIPNADPSTHIDLPAPATIRPGRFPAVGTLLHTESLILSTLDGCRESILAALGCGECAVCDSSSKGKSILSTTVSGKNMDGRKCRLQPGAHAANAGTVRPFLAGVLFLLRSERSN
jgi:hypothetical protein